MKKYISLFILAIFSFSFSAMTPGFQTSKIELMPTVNSGVSNLTYLTYVTSKSVTFTAPGHFLRNGQVARISGIKSTNAYISRWNGVTGSISAVSRNFFTITEAGTNTHNVSGKTLGGIATVNNQVGVTIVLDGTTGIVSGSAFIAPVSSANVGNIYSGTYTADVNLTGSANTSAITLPTCNYMRVGNVVNVSGELTIKAIAAPARTVQEFTLPIVSNLQLDTDCAGAGNINEAVGLNPNVIINASAARDTWRIDFMATTATTTQLQDLFFTFQYVIK